MTELPPELAPVLTSKTRAALSHALPVGGPLSRLGSMRESGYLDLIGLDACRHSCTLRSTEQLPWYFSSTTCVQYVARLTPTGLPGVHECHLPTDAVTRIHMAKHVYTPVQRSSSFLTARLSLTTTESCL